MDPRENRLSSSFAAVLEHARDFGRALFSEWVTDVRDSKLTVAVQQRIAAGTIDVELRFGDANNPELLVWIEAKHGSGLSGNDQLDKYRADLRRMRAGRKVLLSLTPVAFNPKNVDVVRINDDVDDDRTYLASWQEIFAIATRWRDAASAETIEAWLIDEFLRFLKEEGLDERPISRADVVVFDHFADAANAVGSVIRQAEEISRGWAKRLSPAKPIYSVDEYFGYPVASRGSKQSEAWGDANLQWACESVRSSGGRTAFWAGMRSSVARPLGDERNELWLRSLEAKAFMFYSERRSCWIGRSLELAEVADLGSTGVQVERLADFVLDAFRTLTQTEPTAA